MMCCTGDEVMGWCLAVSCQVRCIDSSVCFCFFPFLERCQSFRIQFF